MSSIKKKGRWNKIIRILCKLKSRQDLKIERWIKWAVGDSCDIAGYYRGDDRDDPNKKYI